MQKIIGRGYRKVSVQHNVGRYRIDIVVEGPHARLAVECDGDRWHGPEVWHQDRARQQVLERANWTFERIRGSAFYRDPDTALLPLWQRLADLGIPTGDWGPTETGQPMVREVSGLTPLTCLILGAGHTRRPTHTASRHGTGDGSPQSRPTPLWPAPEIAAGTPRDCRGSGQGSGDDHVPITNAKRNEKILRETLRRQRGGLIGSTRPGPRALPHPETAPLAEIVAGLQDIVAVEGPMRAHRAYRVYTHAAGGHRVGPEMRRTFFAATRQALRSGGLRQLDEDITAPDEKTLYIPGERHQ